MSSITLLIGARPYALDDEGAAWLVETIHDLRKGDEEFLLDEHVSACLRLANSIESQLLGTARGPIELGVTETEGLSSYVLRDYLVCGHEGLTALHEALRRIRGDP